MCHQIYALGEVTYRANLTPVAMAEGAALVNTLYINQPRPVDYENIPTTVFCRHNNR
jgi:glutathione reductase (NADPH)